MNLSNHRVKQDPVKQRKTELVERKGLGHPDSICDGIAEAVSRKLSQEYRNRFGRILHHNTDEVQLVAGEADPEFGSGEIVEPIYILLTGRATKQFENENIPVEKLALEAARYYINENLHLSPSQVEIESKINETSTDLEAVYERDKTLSNDTSFGVGHAPLSPAEKAVKQIERDVRNLERAGDDVKVMGLRDQDEMTVTVAVPGISSKVESIEDYRDLLGQVRQKVREIVSSRGLEPEVYVNTADDIDSGEVYLTVTGTSAENGDDGSVGRGNRVNGLITPHRSMSMEAASGKNPVTHVGKIYNLLAQKIARDIHSETGEYAGVKLLSQIGEPIDDPRLVEVETPLPEKEYREIVERNLRNIDAVTEKCVEGKIKIF